MRVEFNNIMKNLRLFNTNCESVFIIDKRMAVIITSYVNKLENENIKYKRILEDIKEDINYITEEDDE